MLLSTRQQHAHQHTHWIFVTASVLLAATLWSTTIGGASAAPGVFDLSAQQQQTQTLATDLQPPFYTPNADPYSDPTNSRAIDSYGNPIEALKPVVTPDGRKVVSAEGLQFEIPNYASGITELRKPALDLLPPFVGELLTTTTITTPTQAADTATAAAFRTSQATATATSTNPFFNAPQNNSPQANPIIKVSRGTVKPMHAANANANALPQPQQQQPTTTLVDVNGLAAVALEPEASTNTNPTTTTLTKNTAEPVELAKTPNPSPHLDPTSSASSISSTSTSSSSINDTPLTAPKSNLLKRSDVRPLSKQGLQFLIPGYADGITSIESQHIYELNPILAVQPTTFSITKSLETSPLHLPPISIPASSLASLSSPTIPSSIPPLSNGNFNYPNVPNDIETLNRLAAKYLKPTSIPNIDPIVVSLPNDADSSSESSTQTSAATSTGSDSSSSVTVENPSLVQQNQPKPQTKPKYKLLPAYILALNDPDIDGPVDYMPSNTGETLKVIAWDLLPPHMAASLGLPAGSSQDTNTEQAAIQSGEHGTNAHSGEEHRRRTTTTQAPAFTTRNPGAYNQYDNGRYRPKPTPSTAAAITTTPSPRRRPSPTTTTTRATTTTTTTTTRRTTTTTEPTTTVRYDAPQVTTTTPTPFVPDENTEDYFRLENGDSYTLPTWLADFNDTDLDVAVAWEIPKDLSEYNVTVEPDILAPYEPFTDLNVLQVTPSPEEATARPTTTTTTTRRTTTTTTTTRRPTTTTTRFTTTRAPTRATTNWNQRRTTTRPTTTTATPSNAFTAQQPSSLSPNIFFSATNQPNQFTTTYTTTIQPKTTTKQFYSQTTLKPYQTTPITVDIPTSQEADDEQAKPIITNNRQSGAYQPQAFAKRPQATTTTTTSTTTTTTTTTPAPIVVEEEFMNPFDSSTIPPWLAEFDYADVGPGVPFVLNDTSSSTGKLKLEQHAANDANDVHNDLRPPNVEQMQIIGKQNPAPVSGLQPQQKLPSTITTPPTTTTSSSFAITNTKPQNNRNNNNYNNNNYNNNNSNQKNSKYNGIADSFSSTTTTAFLPTTLPPAIASNANLPSKIPIPLPSLNDNQEQVTQPPIVFKPPPPAALDGSSSLGVGGGISESAAVLSLDNTDNQQQTNFAQAPTGQQGQPLPADRERFPPNSNYGNVGQQGVAGQQPAAAAASGFGQRENAQNQGSVTRPAGAAPSNPFLPRQPPFVQPSTPTSFTPVPTDTDNLITSSTINNNQNLPFANSVGATVNNGLAKPNPFGVTPVNNRVGVSGPPQGQQPKKYNWPDFGGPPGVLVPFDNVKSR